MNYLKKFNESLHKDIESSEYYDSDLEKIEISKIDSSKISNLLKKYIQEYSFPNVEIRTSKDEIIAFCSDKENPSEGFLRFNIIKNRDDYFFIRISFNGILFNIDKDNTQAKSKYIKCDTIDGVKEFFS
jgi:hypothetical protein